GDRLDLVGAEAEPASGSAGPEIAIGDEPQRVAGRADVVVDLEAALGRGAVEGAEHALEGPCLLRQRRRRLLSGCHGGACDEGEAETGGEGEGAHQACSTLPEAAGTGFSTAALMLAGRGRVRSSLPSSGSRIRKWK